MSAWPSGMTLRPISNWPGAQTTSRERAPFMRAGGYPRQPMPLSDTLTLLRRELTAIRASSVVLEVALREQDFRNDGFPRSTAKADHPGVILSMNTPKGALRFPCDSFTRWEDNLRAIALALEALRKVDRYGVTKHAEQYAGWRQIESAASERMTETEALGTLRDFAPPAKRDEPLDRLVRWAKAGAHPDRHDGDRSGWDRVEQAARTLGAAS